jgi:2-polyprenyl-6-methoxyphenol hydroxylase-like FAD-dependent oxidoreductase
MTVELDTDIAIVGYGPVGQTLAAMLGRRGRRVAVYERFASLYHLSRAGYFDDEIMQVWQDLDGRLTAWLDEHAVAAVVVRPDHYVFGAVAALDDPPALIDDLRAQLHAAGERHESREAAHELPAVEA